MSWSGGPGCIYGFQEEYTYDPLGRVWERIFTMTASGFPYNPITLTSLFYYDAEGRLTSSTYPAATSSNPNDTFGYTTDHDALGRPSDLYMGTPQQPTPLVNAAAYNAAGQLTAMYATAYTETLQYNANLQLARLTAAPTTGQGIDFTYTYPTGNNGRISQMADNITGEQVSYTYDQLNRLVQSASNVTGTVPFAYDGFGNLTQQGQTSLSVDPTTNRINSAGYQYNANGNVTQTPGPVSYTYDVANRLVSNGAIYNPRNQRVFDGTYIYLYTPEGKLAGKYTPNWSSNGSLATIQGGQPSVYFAGKLIQEQGQWVMTDRLGSVRLRASGERSNYQPYGAEVAPATSDQRAKFATYYRDAPGLDYAGQRYYSNATGRFLTPDPGGVGTADPKSPGSWNRYAYVQGDPVNLTDRRGLCADPDLIWDAGRFLGVGACGPPEQETSGGPGGAGGGCAGILVWRYYPNSETDGYWDCLLGDASVGTTTASGPGQHNPCNDTTDVNFVKAYLPDAQALAQTLHVDPLWILTVGATESTYGTSDAAQLDNNFFGIHWGSVAAANGATQSTRNPIFANWDWGTDGFVGSGNVMVALAIQDGARDVTSALQFFTDIHKQFGVRNANYASDMLKKLASVAARLECP
jgi:RHS repeat-associated protein